MSEITKDMMKIKSMDLDINGMKTLPDVIEMIKDTIDDGTPSDLDSAKDYLDQLGDYLAKRDSHILQTANINTKNIIEEMYNV